MDEHDRQAIETAKKIFASTTQTLTELTGKKYPDPNEAEAIILIAFNDKNETANYVIGRISISQIIAAFDATLNEVAAAHRGQVEIPVGA